MSHVLQSHRNMFYSLFKKQKGVTAQHKRGFFMLELIVAIFIFSIVMMVSLSTLIIALDSNRKVQSLKSVLNNLDIALETMTKALAVGTVYHCSPSLPPSLTTPNDCSVAAGGGKSISFVFNANLGGNPTAHDIVMYKFESDSNGGFISRTIYLDDGTVVGPGRMTAPEVNINDAASRFYVTGSALGVGSGGSDSEQPKVLILINGQTLAGARSGPTPFTVQTVVTERLPDF